MPALDSADEVAAHLVQGAVAPAVAAGWAARTHGGAWLVETGGATASIFDLASVTKPFTAIAVAAAGLRHKTLAELLPEVRGTHGGAFPIETLLAHRAGLPDHLPLYRARLQGQPLDLTHAMRQACALRPELAGSPAQQAYPPVYSDLGYLLVGLALARHDGARDMGEVHHARIIAPLGLGDALGSARAFRERGAPLTERAVPTEDVPFRGGVVRGVVHDENAWALGDEAAQGHAGLFGTVSAVLRFGMAVHDAAAHGHGPLAGLDLGWTMAARPGGTLRAGFDGKSSEGGSTGPAFGPNTYGHLGFTGTSLWIDPDAGIVVSLLSNRVHPTRDNVAIRAARPIAHDALFRLAERARSKVPSSP
jgi:CubicO group peptidase (beta-lactamase class C family)